MPDGSTFSDIPMIIDSFAGGGGASTGIELALGRSPDVAINHNAAALALHAANHPETLHLDSNIWDVDPRSVTQGRRVGLLWASPDCKHFSKAKGGAPRELFGAQGFPPDYVIEGVWNMDGPEPVWAPFSKSVQVSCCGNSVCPPLAEALVRSNCTHLMMMEEAA